MPGLVVRKVWRAIDRVGLYVPGGKTPLFSTLLMLALPAPRRGRRRDRRRHAAAAGRRPRPVHRARRRLVRDRGGLDGRRRAGDRGLGLRRRRHPRVDKICGPGNAWVAEAKTYVASLARRPGDRHAGRAERIAGRSPTARPIRRLVAADLLSQAEHDAVGPGAPRHHLAGAGRCRSRREVGATLATLPRARDRRGVARPCADHPRRRSRRGGRRSPISMRPSICRSRSPIPRRCSRGSAMPARSSPGGSRPRRSATISPARATSFRPTAPRAPGAASRSITFLKAMSVQKVTREAARRHRRPAAAAARPAGGAGSPCPRRRRAAGASRMTSLAARLARPEILALPPFDIAAKANDAFRARTRSSSTPTKIPYPPLGGGALAAERQPLSRAAAGAPRRRRWRRSTASRRTS